MGSGLNPQKELGVIYTKCVLSENQLGNKKQINYRIVILMQTRESGGPYLVGCSPERPIPPWPFPALHFHFLMYKRIAGVS